MTRSDSRPSGREGAGALEVRRLDAPTFAPPVDVFERAEDFEVVVDVPGVLPGDVDVQYADGFLVVEARVAPRAVEGRPLLAEYEVGGFHRKFRLGDGIDVEKIDAKLDAGVLRLTLPKRDAARTRRIPVSTGTGAPGPIDATPPRTATEAGSGD